MTIWPACTKIKSMRRVIQGKWRETVLGRSAQVLSHGERKRVFAVSILQISFGVLDLLGIAVIGMLGALAISGLESKQPGNRVGAVLNFLGISDESLQTQAALLGLAAGLLLVGKTIFSIIFTKKILYFLSRRGARISAMLIEKLLSKSLLVIQSRSTQQTVFAITAGVEAITIGIIASSISIVADLFLLLFLSAGLFYVDPLVAFSSVFVFGLVGFILYRMMHKRAQDLGAEFARLSIQGNEKILEILHLYREAVVSNRRSFYANEIGKIRLGMADANAEMKFMPSISKYVIEMTMVFGALLISASQFFIHDTARAVAVLAVFLASSTRIGPAILRIQQSAIQIRSQAGNAKLTLEMIKSLAWTDSLAEADSNVRVNHAGFSASIDMAKVTLTYPGKTTPAINKVDLHVKPGSVVALVGPSGAGKTTFVDLLLGILPPDAGKITISKIPPLEAIEKWPGSIGYVPQNVVITNGSIRENVGLGFPIEKITDELVWEALDVAHLLDFVELLPNRLDSHVGDAGSAISGGQRQRLGIARAMFTKPKLLVLDEATSSLDGETEASITDSIQSLKGSVTVVLIAHRLSTVRQADVLVYISDGKIVATGSFDEVRASVPDFDHQAKLMGL